MGDDPAAGSSTDDTLPGVDGPSAHQDSPRANERVAINSNADTLAPESAPLDAGADTMASAEPRVARSFRSDSPLRRGDCIGRYVVIDFLGAGGMGAVYAAYDPELDRKIAVKVMLGHGLGHEERIRLVREAQALARLQHPNVVAVYDAGEHGGRVFVAMEFVRGCTLSTWLKKHRPSRDAITRVFAEAGRGLAAAHAERLVHRDFKPDNVMLDLRDAEIERVRVMDFGLARAHASTEPTLEDPSPSPSTLSAELTQAGTVMGTPAYMAPEQFAAGEVDARTDQFSFCIALYEAFVGRRPFAGDSVAELATNVCSASAVTIPPRAKVPAHLRRVLVRGLSKQREDRFPSMHELLVQLEYDPRRRNRWIALGSMAVLVAAGVLGTDHLQAARALAACDDEGATIDEAWNPRLADALRATASKAGTAYAATTADNVVKWLDPYAERWADLRRQTCVAATIDTTIDDDLRRRTEACLDERRAALSELVTQLVQGDSQLLEGAVMAAAKLDTVESCGDAGWLLQQPAVAPEVREQTVALRERLGRVSSLIAVGKYDEAMQRVRRIADDAQQLGVAGLHARARLVTGNLHELFGDLEAARNELVEAELEASAGGADDVAASATRILVNVAHRRGDGEEGLEWGRRATMWLDRMGTPDNDIRRADLANHLGNAHHMLGQIDLAGEHYRRALDIRLAVLGDEHPAVAASLHNLAGFSYSRQAYDDAVDYSERALSIWEKTLGLEHPDVAGTISNLGAIYGARGDGAKGVEYLQRALKLRERTLGPDHVDVATTLHNLGRAQIDAGQRDAALETLQRALAIRREKLAADHPHLQSTIAAIERAEAL
jgi:eukaryotic-like serine/threonine-protein kinase